MFCLQDADCNWIPPCQIVIKRSALLADLPPSIIQYDQTKPDICTCPAEEKQSQKFELEDESINEINVDTSEEDNRSASIEMIESGPYKADQTDEGLKISFDLDEMFLQPKEIEEEVSDFQEDKISFVTNKSGSDIENPNRDDYRSNDFLSEIKLIFSIPIKVFAFTESFI